MTATQSRFDIRRAADRGRTRINWLDSWHSFSFGAYRDRERVGFACLRVINDDIIAPGGGFGEHPHENMEILTWVLEGQLAHRDSTGRSGVIGHGDLQMMSAGRGIRHSEVNASGTDPVHLLQIWIKPAVRDIEPAYEDRTFAREGRQNRWQTLASPDGRDGSLTIHQDAIMSVTQLDPGASLELRIEPGRNGYLHLARGAVAIDDTKLASGDAITLTQGATLAIKAMAPSELLFFNLA